LPLRYLAQDERIILEVHRHFAMLFKPFAQTIGIVFGAMFLGTLLSPDDGGDFLDTILGLAAIASVIRFFWLFWLWRVDRIYVTDRRLFEVSGIVTKSVNSMPLAKMTDLTYRRTLGGRILGYGEVIVESAGQNQALARIGPIPDPDDFYRSLTTVGLMPRPSDSVRRAAQQASPEQRRLDPDLADTGELPRVRP
jgi:hypothetical protein